MLANETDPDMLRYNHHKMIPEFDKFLGGSLILCSVIAVMGNITALWVMGRICWKGNAKFSTIIFLNIATANLVIGATSWMVTAPSLLSGDRLIPGWYMDEHTVKHICTFFLVNTEKILSAVVLYSISYLAVTKLILYINPLRTNPNRYYLLSHKTTIIVLVHFWAALILFCCYPVVMGGSKFEPKVSKCIYDGMEQGKKKLVTWLSLYNFLCVILPLLLLLTVSTALISRLILLLRRQDKIFKDCSPLARSVVQVRSKRDIVRTILFAVNCLACYTGIMFVALKEFVDLVRKTGYSSVTKDMPYAVVIGLGILFSVNAAINPWIYLVNNDSFSFVKRSTSFITDSRKTSQPQTSSVPKHKNSETTPTITVTPYTTPL